MVNLLHALIKESPEILLNSDEDLDRIKNLYNLVISAQRALRGIYSWGEVRDAERIGMAYIMNHKYLEDALKFNVPVPPGLK